MQAVFRRSFKELPKGLLFKYPKRSFSDGGSYSPLISYSGGQANVGQGGYYGSGGN